MEDVIEAMKAALDGHVYAPALWYADRENAERAANERRDAAVRAALTAAEAKGWKLVPVVATEEMCEAAIMAAAGSVWTAMVAAAPAPEKE